MKTTLAALMVAIPASVCLASDYEHYEHAAHGGPADHDHTGPAVTAPIGVMADHTHHTGGWMVSYRWMSMDMEGSRTGERRLSDREVLARYMIAPLRMEMEMDMLGVMYAPSARLTWMLMIPRVELTMEHQNRMGGHFTTESEGIGDISVSALLTDRQEGDFRSNFQLGLRAPTGQVNVYDTTLMGPNTLLPYPMRLSGGTPAVILGYTQVRDLADGARGLQFRATLPFGRAEEGYRLGNELLVTGWRQWEVGEKTAMGARLAWSHWGDLDGADPRLNRNMVPTADAGLRAGDRLEVGVGVNWTPRKGHRVALEYLLPLHQDLGGPQLEVDRTWMIGFTGEF